MKTTPDSCFVDVPTWHVTVSADNGPLLLARVLQKFAVPEIELLAAHYTREIPSGVAELHLNIRAHPNRARLAVVRLRSLLHVRSVGLVATDSQKLEEGFTPRRSRA